MGWLSVLVQAAAVVGQAAALPPPSPRPGTTSRLEHDAVAVWNGSWLTQQYPLHTRRYGLVGISYAEVVFDGTATPRAAFVPAGTVHAAPTPPDGGRVYIFEITVEER